MSLVAPPERGIDSSGNDTLDYARTYVQRLRGGEVGSLPAIVGLVVITVFFAIVHDGFLDAYNVEALVVQAAPTIIMAMGLVFVLLLGEIDLSAGTAGGLCAAVMAMLMTRHHVNWIWAVLAALATGLVIGAALGWLRAKVRIPSFVSTLATFLGFQGVVLILIGGQGSITIHSDWIIGIEGLNGNLVPVWLGWALLAVIVAGYAFTKVRHVVGRRRAELSTEPLQVVVAKVVALAVLGAIFVYVLGENRSFTNNAFFHSKTEGMPWSVVLILVLFFGWNYLLNHTRYGRHIYAVGGNAEAARRAGIRVAWVRFSVFAICSTMAAISGVVQAGELESVASNAGAGNTLLLAVGAAVIGGTSLFGGRGRIVDAVWGGLVVAVITNGMADLIQGSNSSGWQWIVTGAVLLLAAGVDAVSRWRGGAATEA